MRNMRESYNELVNQNAQLAADVQAIKDAHILGFSYDGVVFAEGFEPTSSFGLVANRHKISVVYDDSDTMLPNMIAADYPLLEEFVMTNANYGEITSGKEWMNGSSSLKIIRTPRLQLINPYAFVGNMPNLRLLDLEYADFNNYYPSISNTPNLIDVIIGKGFSSSRDILSLWNPTNALLSDSSSLLTTEDIAAGFTSNLEKLLYNIREHIAANLPSRVGQSPFTITFSQTLRNAFDQETEEAFAARGWSIAPAKSI